MKIFPVILSGGSGTRLWPLSRKQYPKQFLSLLGNKSLFQETLLRLHGINNLAEPIVICNNDHRFLVAEQLNQIGIKNPSIILEPVGKNTAPAIAAAAIFINNNLNINDSVMLVLSADHDIKNIQEFQKKINIAVKNAQKRKLVTFGVLPDSPNTGYGYIKYEAKSKVSVFSVESFEEKPDLKTAEAYINSGNYLWNSGMFAFEPRHLIDEMTSYCSELVIAAEQSLRNSKKDLDFIRLEENAFKLSPNISIDYALMEKSKNVVVIELDVGWSDVGSWSSLYNSSKKDKNGNVLKGDIFTEDTYGSLIDAGSHLVATIGVSDLIVVDTPDATLISSRKEAHKVKNIVDNLQNFNREESNNNRKVFRPWGWYDSIESGKNFQVKRLHVNPKAKLSLQMHSKRAEHWVVIDGEASVINGEQALTLLKGESTYIPVGVTHSLENKTNKTLEIIEVQSGSYLGEDDIVRYEDVYGRID